MNISRVIVSRTLARVQLVYTDSGMHRARDSKYRLASVFPVVSASDQVLRSAKA